MSKPRCEDIGFKHLWFEQGNPGPDWKQWNAERTCVNCGKVERRYIVVRQREVTEWRDVQGPGRRCQMSKTNCEEVGFKHMWDIDDYGFYVYKRDREGHGFHISRMWGHNDDMMSKVVRTCANCGKQQKWKCIREPVLAVWAWQEVPPDANG